MNARESAYSTLCVRTALCSARSPLPAAAPRSYYVDARRALLTAGGLPRLRRAGRGRGRAPGRGRGGRPDAGRRPDRVLGAVRLGLAEGVHRAQGAQGARPPALDRGPADRARRARTGGRGRRHLRRLADHRDRAGARGGSRAGRSAGGRSTGWPAAARRSSRRSGPACPTYRCSRSTTSTRTARTASPPPGSAAATRPGAGKARRAAPAPRRPRACCARARASV